jgi:hypothetical protein
MATGDNINDRKVVNMKVTILPEGAVSRFESCVPESSSYVSLSNGIFHYEIVCKDCKPWI